MTKFTSADPLPKAMQGEWIDAEDAASTMSVQGAEVIYRSAAIAYDHYEIVDLEGTTTVKFAVDDPDRQDAFDRENLTGLVLDPEGDLFGYNCRFGCRFVPMKGDQ